MLSCKKCGAEMSGIDLVCKECGTPWGKTGKSKAPLFFSFILICAFSFAIIYFTNPTLFKTSKTPSANDIENEQNIIDEPPVEGNIPTEENPPVEEQPPIIEEPPIEILPPVFTNSKASSSTKPYGSFTYTPNKTTDNNTETAWLEGVKGNGINEWIEFSAETEQYVNGFVLYNGYQKNEKTYINNGKISKLLVTFSDGTKLEYELPKQTFSESQKGNTIKFTETVKTKSIRFTILDVEKGAYYDDTGITEIKFY